jgi:hypothetical protein
VTFGSSIVSVPEGPFVAAPAGAMTQSDEATSAPEVNRATHPEMRRPRLTFTLRVSSTMVPTFPAPHSTCLPTCAIARGGFRQFRPFVKANEAAGT